MNLIPENVSNGIQKILLRSVGGFFTGLALAVGFTGGVALLAEVPRFRGDDHNKPDHLNKVVDGINQMERKLRDLEKRVGDISRMERQLEDLKKQVEENKSASMDRTGHSPMWRVDWGVARGIRTGQSVVIGGDLHVQGKIVSGNQ